jgi:peptide/nickel transport system ATP-binding protein
VLRQPRNPYTVALLAARPRPGAPRGERLATIPTAPRAAREQNIGCPFAGRCALTLDICRAVAPPEVVFGAGQISRCHRAVEVGVAP